MISVPTIVARGMVRDGLSTSPAGTVADSMPRKAKSVSEAAPAMAASVDEYCGGTVGAKGSVDWTDTVNPKVDATLTAREALLLRDDSISMRANADITCRGSLQQANVAGTVELVRGRVFKEIEFLPLSPHSLIG